MTTTPSFTQRLGRRLTSASAMRAWRGLLWLLLLAVSYLALTPQPPPTIDLGWDKLNHLAAFTSLAVAASLGYPASARRRLVLLVALLAFGGLIEILQLQVPGRSGEWADLLADSVGIVVGAAIAAGVMRAASLPLASGH